MALVVMTIGTRVVVTAGRWTGMHGTIEEYADEGVTLLWGDEERHDLYVVKWDRPNVLQGMVRLDHMRLETASAAFRAPDPETLRAWLDA